MECTTLARPYAKAAFDHAMALDRAGQNGLGQWFDALSLVAQLIAIPAMVEVLSDPKLSAMQKAELLLELGQQDFPKFAQNFIKVLAENARLSLIPDILTVFKELKAEQEQAIECIVSSAFPVNDEQKKQLINSLEQRFKKTVALEVELDPSLLGGIVIRSGDQVIDGSIRGKLNKLAESITL